MAKIPNSGVADNLKNKLNHSNSKPDLDLIESRAINRNLVGRSRSSMSSGSDLEESENDDNLNQSELNQTGNNDSSTSSNDLSNDNNDISGEGNNQSSPPLNFNGSAKATKGGTNFSGKDIKNSKLKIILGLCGGSSMFIILTFFIILVSYSVGDLYEDYLKDIGETILDFFTIDKHSDETKYYERLRYVQKKIYQDSDEEICIDANLITAALIVDIEFDQSLDEGKVPDPASESEENSSTDYTKMKKQIDLLAYMQIKRRIMGWDTRVRDEEHSPVYPCRPSTYEEAEEELVTEENYMYYQPVKAGSHRFATPEEGDSSTPELVASHDRGDFWAFFMKKADQEKNWEYFMYRPVAESRCKQRLADGSCRNDVYEDYCPDVEETEDDPEEEWVLSIGDVNNPVNTMKDGVFYWNLVNSFIPEYYKKYLPADEESEEYTAKIHEIAEKIYLLYKSMGPSQMCSIFDDEEPDIDDGSYNPSCITTGGTPQVSNLKVQLIKNNGEPLGEPLLDLEEYIMGVVYAEYFSPSHLEASKAQAVAARTYLVKLPRTTDSEGNTVIKVKNSTYNQVYCNPYTGCYWSRRGGSEVYSQPTGDATTQWKPPLSGPSLEALKSVINATIGEVMYDASGKILSINYNSTMQNRWAELDAAGMQYLEILADSYGSLGSVTSECQGATGDWANWKQSDPEWARTPIGGNTLGAVGCYVTSIAILIARSGTTVLLNPFNPGTFATYLNSKGSFGPGGGMTTLQHIPEIVPGFSLNVGVHALNFDMAGNRQRLIQAIAPYLQQGKYVQLHVTNHFVAVDRIDGDELYINDPGSGCTAVSRCDYINRKTAIDLRIYTIN